MADVSAKSYRPAQVHADQTRTDRAGSPARQLSIARRCLFALLTAGMVFGALEVGLRLLGEAQIQPRTRIDYSDGDVSPFELWAVGDSNTFGIGASNPAVGSYPAVAATRLSERLRRPVELRNLGVPGANSTVALQPLREALATGAEPDLVVALIRLHNSGWIVASGQFCLRAPGGG